MEQEKKEWKETIHYIKTEHEDGKVSYTGQSVNYGCICSSWKSIEDLYHKMEEMINVYIAHAQKTLEQPDPLNMVECKTIEEWDSRDDNITYWELERMKRIMKRLDVQEVWKKIIHEEANDYWEKTNRNPADELPDIIIKRFINSKIE